MRLDGQGRVHTRWGVLTSRGEGVLAWVLVVVLLLLASL